MVPPSGAHDRSKESQALATLRDGDRSMGQTGAVGSEGTEPSTEQRRPPEGGEAWAELKAKTLLIYCCVTNSPQTSWLKNSKRLIFHSFWGSSIQTLLSWIVVRGCAISYSRGFSQPRDRTCLSCISCISRQSLYHLGHLGSSQYHTGWPKNIKN